MRITIDIPDELHAKLKALAKLEGTTMRTIILEGINAVLNGKAATVQPEGMRQSRLPHIRTKRPGTLKLDKEGVYQYIPFP